MFFFQAVLVWLGVLCCWFEFESSLEGLFASNVLGWRVELVVKSSKKPGIKVGLEGVMS